MKCKKKTSILLSYILKVHTWNMNADTASEHEILQSKKEYRLKINAMLLVDSKLLKQTSFTTNPLFVQYTVPCAEGLPELSISCRC